MFTKNSIDYFNKFAKYYRDYSKSKSAYLNSVDEIVINRIKDLKAKSLLDIGSGDGIRAINIAQKAGIKTLSLVDSSIEMINLSKAAKIPLGLNVEFYHMSGEELWIDNQFEAITCLWNVLGHMSNRNERIKTLKKMANMLSQEGSIFLDVNNRHNIAAYGLFLGGRHILRDIFSPSDSNGDISFQHELNGISVQGSGHLFSPNEIDSIIKESGLKVVKRVVLNYKTGQLRHSLLSGQLFFELKLN